MRKKREEIVPGPKLRASRKRKSVGAWLSHIILSGAADIAGSAFKAVGTLALAVGATIRGIAGVGAVGGTGVAVGAGVAALPDKLERVCKDGPVIKEDADKLKRVCEDFFSL